MADQQKKYSLINLDTGEAEEAAGVRTTRSVVDGEETIVVQSAPTGGEDASNVTASEPAQQAEARAEAPLEDHCAETEDHAVTTVAWSKPKPKAEDGTDGEEEVPFKRMQAIIIVCLIALIVIFFVYFNFLR